MEELFFLRRSEEIIVESFIGSTDEVLVQIRKFMSNLGINLLAMSDLLEIIRCRNNFITVV